MTFGPSGVFGNQLPQQNIPEKCAPVVFKTKDESTGQNLFCVDFGKEDVRCVDFDKSDPKRALEDIQGFLEEENQCIKPSIQIGNDGAIDYIKKGWEGNF